MLTNPYARLIISLSALAAVTLALMATVAAIAQIPFDAVAGSVLVAEIAAGSTLAAAAIARRAGRQRWTPAPPRNDHIDRLPVQRVDAEVVEPQQAHPQRLALPAPQRQEVVKR